MHPSHLLGGGLLIAALGWFAVRDGRTAPLDLHEPPPAPPVADGRITLVVRGDRDQLAIANAVAKPDAWAGVPKGLASAWSLRIHGGDGAVLAEVPLDLSQFDLAPERKGRGVQVEGCIVRDPAVAMIVDVPRFAEAALYTFVRRDGGGEVEIGAVTGEQVRAMTGGPR